MRFRKMDEEKSRAAAFVNPCLYVLTETINATVNACLFR